jgi:hypothetical protein
VAAYVAVYGVTLVALFLVAAVREGTVSGDNATVCGSLAGMYLAAMLRGDLLHVPRIGPSAAAALLNVALLVGSRFDPVALYRRSRQSSSDFRRLEDSGASVDELARFESKTGSGLVLLLWVAGAAVLVALRPKWFGF